MGKKEKTHKLLLDTAVSLFIRKRSSNVSLDEVADAADVARRTIYYHFSSKEVLILEITEPILNDGLEFLQRVETKETVLLSDITDLCLLLWDKYGMSLNLLYNIDFEDFQTLKTLHLKYLRLYSSVFDRVADLPRDLHGCKMEIASLIFRSFVLILSRIEKMDNRESRFEQCIRGMVEGLGLE